MCVQVELYRPQLQLIMLLPHPYRSSRLIFRNLPNTVDLSTFRTHLSQPSQLADTTLTDVKLVSKRRFAFVGYKTDDEARRAKEWFDGTFLGSGKIKVDFVDDDVSPYVFSKVGTTHVLNCYTSRDVPG